MEHNLALSDIGFPLPDRPTALANVYLDEKGDREVRPIVCIVFKASILKGALPESGENR